MTQIQQSWISQYNLDLWLWSCYNIGNLDKIGIIINWNQETEISLNLPIFINQKFCKRKWITEFGKLLNSIVERRSIYEI